MNYIRFKHGNTLRQACWAGRMVPPPTVPTSIQGMVQLMYRSSWVGPVASIKVIQLLLATHWAGSCKILTNLLLISKDLYNYNVHVLFITFFSCTSTLTLNA